MKEFDDDCPFNRASRPKDAEDASISFAGRIDDSPVMLSVYQLVLTYYTLCNTQPRPSVVRVALLFKDQSLVDSVYIVNLANFERSEEFRCVRDAFESTEKFLFGIKAKVLLNFPAGGMSQTVRLSVFFLAKIFGSFRPARSCSKLFWLA